MHNFIVQLSKSINELIQFISSFIIRRFTSEEKRLTISYIILYYLEWSFYPVAASNEESAHGRHQHHVRVHQPLPAVPRSSTASGIHFTHISQFQNRYFEFGFSWIRFISAALSVSRIASNKQNIWKIH